MLGSWKLAQPMQQNTVDSHSIPKVCIDELTAVGEGVSTPEGRGTDDFY